MFNFDSPIFSLLYSLGVDISSIDFSTISDGELMILGLIIIIATVFITLCVRGIFYVIRELCGSVVR